MKASCLIVATSLCISSRALVPFSTTSSRQQPSRRAYNNALISPTDRLFASSLEIDFSNEDVFNDSDESESPLSLPSEMLKFPRHSNDDVNDVLIETEALVQNLHHDSKAVDPKSTKRSMSPTMNTNDSIFANTYVDLGNVDTVGFDYDYTLVHYTEELLTLLYSMALTRLVNDRHYPTEMLSCGLQYDSYFSIRGLAVDRETGWICHLSYTHKVAVAWEGREKVSTSRIFEEYRGKRGLNPRERKARLKPLNDLFSMAECCLIADTIQYFKDNDIDFCSSNVVTDILGAIRDTHISGDFHRIVANNPKKYFDPTPHLKGVLRNLKGSGKRLIFASNSPFWYVDAGMKYVLGDEWMDIWDAVIVSAGKPAFYTETRRPFREVNTETNRVRFQKVEKLESGKVFTEGCLRELTKLMDWRVSGDKDDGQVESMGPLNMNSNVLYIGDSLFADLVDAKREYGWLTAAVTPEVGFELDVQQSSDHLLAERTIAILLNALRKVQSEMGTREYTSEDSLVLDKLEKLVSRWRDRETNLLGNPFGSVFRARYQPSLFAHSLRRYCDLYMNTIGSLRLYSPQHRFYPEPDFRLLAHEIKRSTEAYCTDSLLEEPNESDSNCVNGC
uniref:5'-nucleotidase domain-containing protein n=1 Tax=Pseudo-nitzschia australis TaxID=44445 RepID=A0A7S4AAZ1_9STRA